MGINYSEERFGLYGADLGDGDEEHRVGVLEHGKATCSTGLWSFDVDGQRLLTAGTQHLAGRIDDGVARTLSGQFLFRLVAE